MSPQFQPALEQKAPFIGQLPALKRLFEGKVVDPNIQEETFTEEVTSPNPFRGMVQSITKQYPRLGGADWQVFYGDQKNNTRRGHLEFYPPDERDNPRPGKPSIEVFNRSVGGDDLRQMVFGDMLHHLSDTDPEWKRLRNKYSDTISRERKLEEYDFAKGQGETRDLKKWWDVSRLDAHVRGYIADQWPKDDGFYSDKQKDILREMQQLLTQPRGAR